MTHMPDRSAYETPRRGRLPGQALLDELLPVGMFGAHVGNLRFAAGRKKKREQEARRKRRQSRRRKRWRGSRKIISE